MQRIVDGIVFEGKVVPDAWDVATWRQNGVMERSVRPVVEWRELGQWDQRQILDACGFPVEPREDTLDEAEEKRQRSLQKAAQRAKQTCRRVIIAEGFDELLTITYRENQQDRNLCKRHFKEWVRRMKRALGGTFRYCASFEKQERGAMHVHVACHKLPQHAAYRGMKVKGWRLGTDVWRGIVGAGNGLVFVGGKGKNGVPRRDKFTLAKMAAYVSKYIMKDYESAPEESNRYSRSNGVEVGPVHRERVTGMTLLDVMVATFDLGEGDVLVSHRLSCFRDSVWLCTEARPPRPH